MTCKEMNKYIASLSDEKLIKMTVTAQEDYSSWAEVEQVKAAEQSRKELEFMSDVQQGVAVICKKLHKGETSFIVTHSAGYSEGWILFCCYVNKRYMAEVNHILNRSGWQVEITPVGHHPIDKYPVSVEVIVSRTDKEE